MPRKKNPTTPTLIGLAPVKRLTRTFALALSLIYGYIGGRVTFFVNWHDIFNQLKVFKFGLFVRGGVPTWYNPPLSLKAELILFGVGGTVDFALLQYNTSAVSFDAAVHTPVVEVAGNLYVNTPAGVKQEKEQRNYAKAYELAVAAEEKRIEERNARRRERRVAAAAAAKKPSKSRSKK